MKYLKDLVISRKDFQDWYNNLHWGADGSIFLTTIPDLTLLEPIYNSDIEGQCKNLFHAREYPLAIDNKFEFVNSQKNSLLNGQPESFVRSWVPSPDSLSEMFAVLTNNCNVIIYQRGQKLISLDEELKPLANRTYHSMSWSNDGQFMVVGNEDSEVVVFRKINNEDNATFFEYMSTIKISETSLWITHLYISRNFIIVGSSDNSVYNVEFDDNFNAKNIKQLLTSKRFKLIDAKIIDNTVLITTSYKLYCFNLANDIRSDIILPLSEGYKIISYLPKRSELILISSSNCIAIKIEDFKKLTIIQDTIVTPQLDKKYKKWKNRSQEEYGNCTTNIRIYGSCVSADQNSLAIIFNFERVVPKYTITSETQYRLMVLPLHDSWTISRKAAGLALFQTYNIYDKSSSQLNDSISTEIIIDNTKDDFKTYIHKLLSLEQTNKIRFENFIQKPPSIEFLRQHILKYAIDHVNEISNPLDKACIISLAAITKKSVNIQPETLEFKSEFINENFTFTDKQDSDVITSTERHSWKRCFITLLPLLSTKVRICPVSNQRMIDIEKDELNEYGWFTRTLLEMFHDQSAYTGAGMK